MLVWYLSSFLFGISAGSFLNVVIDRLPRGESVLTGRSRCDHCGHRLKWYELVPLVSFVAQRGRCRECGQRLSLQYPIIEFLTGVLTVVVLSAHSGQFAEHSFTQLLVVGYFLLVTYTLLAISVIDLKEGIIPDGLIVFLIAVAVVFVILSGGVAGVEGSLSLSETSVRPLRDSSLALRMTAALGASVFLFLLAEGAERLVKKPALGFGDVKFALAMGLILGWPSIVVAMYLAFALGAIVALVLMALGKKKFGQTIPFGPFLATATWVTMLWGEELLGWYLTLTLAI